LEDNAEHAGRLPERPMIKRLSNKIVNSKKRLGKVVSLCDIY